MSVLKQTDRTTFGHPIRRASERGASAFLFFAFFLLSVYNTTFITAGVKSNVPVGVTAATLK